MNKKNVPPAKLRIEHRQFDTASGAPMRIVQNTLASGTLTTLPGEVLA